MSRKIMAILLASAVGLASMAMAGCDVEDDGAGAPPGGDTNQPAAPGPADQG